MEQRAFVRIAVVGAGLIGRQHAVHVAAGRDPLLAARAPEAVIIATPKRLHGRVKRAAVTGQMVHR